MDGLASWRHGRLIVALACCMLVALPFLVVQFPPITDLPQNLAQIRLFVDAWQNPTSPYRIQWLTPNVASYPFLAIAWAFCSPENAGRVGMLALALACTVAVHGFAARRQRPLAAVVLASVFVFNHAFYWGFLNFTVGWMTFMLWFVLTARAPAPAWRWRDAVQLCAVAALLFVSHALWLAVGMLWLVIHALLHRVPLRRFASRLASVAPVLLIAIVWYPQLEQRGFVSPTVWADGLLTRLTPAWAVDAALGGIRGPSEDAILLLVLGWIAAAAATVWQKGWQGDVDCLAAALMFAALGMILPDQHMNTILFATRWIPPAVVLLLLALPEPAVLKRWQGAVAFAGVATFCLATALAWHRFEHDELSGLHEALAGVPQDARIVGLDFAKESLIIKGRPFLQTFAYAQVLHGGTLNMSFAGFPASLVVYRTRPERPWTGELEWFAERAQATDLAYFDYALLNGGDQMHGAMSSVPHLIPRTREGRWRLYQVAHSTS